MRCKHCKMRGSLRLWALGVSVAAHLAALTALGAIGLNRRDSATSLPADISVHTIERVIEQGEPKPKPAVEPAPTARPTVSTPQPKTPPSSQPCPRPETAPVKPLAAAPPSPETVMFYGDKTTAERVVYVVDGSGSMFGLMYLVREQLRQSILKLTHEQAFNVVFFMQHDRLFQPFDGVLRSATPATKAEALNLIDRVRPEGRTCAESALAEVMRMRDCNGNKTQIIYFLSDGFDLTETAGRAFVRRIEDIRNRIAPATVIHTIGIYPDTEDGRILRQLAQACGGRYIQID